MGRESADSSDSTCWLWTGTMLGTPVGGIIHSNSLVGGQWGLSFRFLQPQLPCSKCSHPQGLILTHVGSIVHPTCPARLPFPQNVHAYRCMGVLPVSPPPSTALVNSGGIGS